MSFTANECTCSAYFTTEEELVAHIEEFQFQASYHAAQLEKCRAHSRPNGDEDDDDYEKGPGRPPSHTRVCPHKECKRLDAFPTSQKLQRHFQQHVTCNEVCVFCFKVFTRASGFMRHVEKNHRDANGRKGTYTLTTYKELKDRIASELHLSATASEFENKKSWSRKRGWEEAGMEPVIPEAQRIKGPRVNCLDSGQYTNVLDQVGPPSFPTMQSASTSMSIADVTEDVTFAAVDGFGSISTQAPYLPGGDVKSYWSAPLLQLISSVPSTPPNSSMSWFK